MKMSKMGPLLDGRLQNLRHKELQNLRHKRDKILDLTKYRDLWYHPDEALFHSKSTANPLANPQKYF